MNVAPKLLILEPRRLGDAILSLPLVRSALERYDVYVCCHPASLPIYLTLLPHNHLYPLIAPWDVGATAGWFSRKFRQHCQRLNVLKFDVILSVWPDIRVHLWMNLIHANKRVGFPMNKQNYYGWERPWRHRQLKIGMILQCLLAFLLRRSVLDVCLDRRSEKQPHLESWHQMADALALMWRVDVPWFNPPGLYEFHPLVRFIDRVRAEGRFLLLVHTGAHSPLRRWPLIRFSNLLNRLANRNDIAVLMVRGPNDAPLETSDPWQQAYTPCDLNDLFAVTGTADRVLCNDSLMSHLAGALGKQVHTLFGSASPDWFAPFGNRERVISHNVCRFRPCLDRCVYSSPICIESISVNEVADVIVSPL